MTLIFFFGGGGVGGEEVRWKTVRTYGKILATPLSCHFNVVLINKMIQLQGVSIRKISIEDPLK